MKFILDILTGVDGKTFDVGRVLGAVSALIGLSLQVYVVVWKSAPFDMTTFGAGVAALAAGIGAMLKLKENSEPPRSDEHV